MKLIYNMLMAVSVLLLLSSCYKDHGKYTYDIPEQITVTGINSSYDKITQVDRLVMDPQVSSTDPKAVFTYFWGIYETNVQGGIPKVDTIARTQRLDYLVTQPAKGWVLVFGATNKNTGLTKIITSEINVVTPFTRGWYVVKDDGAHTDVDLFFTPQKIAPASKTENVFSLVNKKQLAGKAKLFCFNVNYKSAVTGVMGNTRALFILSDEDATVVNINTFKEIRSFQQFFYDAPAVKRPSSVFDANLSSFFVNDGQLHSIYGMSGNIGLFGGRQLRNDANAAYDLSPYFLASPFDNPFLYDRLSSSFVAATGGGNVLSPVTAAGGSEMSANGIDKDLLFMGVRSIFPYAGVAFFREKKDPSRKMLTTITPMGFSLKLMNDTLGDNDKLHQATRMGLIVADENILYFAIGNEVWSRNLVNGFEQLQYTAPAGEVVNFIRHRSYSGNAPAEMPYYFNYLMVGTTAGGKYKVHMFRKSSGNLLAAPDFTLEGQGSVGDVIYIAPSVMDLTYVNSY